MALPKKAQDRSQMLTHLPDSAQSLPRCLRTEQEAWQGQPIEGPVAALGEQLQRARPALFMPQVPGAKKIQMGPVLFLPPPILQPGSFSRRLFPLCCSVCGRQIPGNPPDDCPPAYASIHTGPQTLKDWRYGCCLSQGTLSNRSDPSRLNPTQRMEEC